MPKISRVLPEHKLQLTSVKVHPHVMKQFKEVSIHSIGLQNVVNRSLHLFANDPAFRDIILNYTALLPSGSL